MSAIDAITDLTISTHALYEKGREFLNEDNSDTRTRQALPYGICETASDILRDLDNSFIEFDERDGFKYMPDILLGDPSLITYLEAEITELKKLQNIMPYMIEDMFIQGRIYALAQTIGNVHSIHTTYGIGE